MQRRSSDYRHSVQTHAGEHLQVLSLSSYCVNDQSFRPLLQYVDSQRSNTGPNRLFDIASAFT